MRTEIKAMGLSLALLAGGAWAQVASPPPVFVPRPEVVIPPPPPPPRPIPPAPRPGTPEAIQVPDIPYVSILQKDTDGKVVRVSEYVELLALKHNPTVGPKTIEKIRPVVREWQEKMDTLVRENLDLVIDVDTGLFDSLDFSNEQDVMLANETMKALITVGGLNNYLLKKEAIQRVQFDFNARLTQEYKQAVNIEVLEKIKADLIAELGKEDRAEFFRRGAKHTFRMLCDDAMWSYDRQLHETAGRLDEALAKAQIPTSGEPGEAAAAVKQAADDQARLEAMRALMATLEFEQQQALLNATAELIGERDMAELDDAAIKPDGAEPKEPEGIDAAAHGG